MRSKSVCVCVCVCVDECMNVSLILFYNHQRLEIWAMEAHKLGNS